MPRRPKPDEGFTMVELLIVMVILPLIIGAATLAIITTVRNDASVSARVADSDNAQLGAAYFGRDVSGALELTTKSTNAPGFTSGGTAVPFLFDAPQICGPQSILSGYSVPATESLLVAFYRPAQTTAGATDVAYWLEGSGPSTQLTRYSCSLSASTFAASNPGSVDLGDVATNPNAPDNPVASTGVTAMASITPSQISQAASAGWTNTEAQTVFDGAAAQTLGGGTPFSLPIASTAGFVTGSMTVLSDYGLQTVSCTVTQGTTTFTNCSGGTGIVSIGATITQATVSGVSMTVTEPSSSYRYVLNGAPQGANTGSLHTAGGPVLLVLNNNGVDLSGTGHVTCSLTSRKDKLCVNGQVILDGGIAKCLGGAAIGSVLSIGDVSWPNGSSCNRDQITTSPVVDDYLVQNLPSPCFATVPSLSTSSATSGTLTPGLYTQPISNAVLEPGVYVLAGGIGSGSNGGGLSQASPSPTDPYYQVLNGQAPGSGVANYDANAGVLLYVPGFYAPGTLPAGCYSATSAATSIMLGDPYQTGIAVSPLDAGQSSYWFSSPNLADMWLWQDANNTQPLTLSGNTSIATTSGAAPSCSAAGIAYAPGAALVTGSGGPTISTGRMIVGGVSLGGTPSIYLSGC